MPHCQGSSPRVRGKRSRSTRHCRCSWIIPARAGQTQETSGKNTGDADHPRACGANRFFPSAVVCAFGSSPRVRGKQRLTGRFRATVRIIPARAGQTDRQDRTARHQTDHPRACGANTIFSAKAVSSAGSSPRVRGKRGGHRVDTSHGRIIPARAGQTSNSRSSATKPSDHPRACGANVATLEALTAVDGSSPRVRGKQRLNAVRVAVRRIIPARAGQTCWR